MNFEHPSMKKKAGNIVYVKTVSVSDLPLQVQEAAREQVGSAETLYAVHRENGERLALVADRDLAFDLARQHDFAPVALH